MPVTTDVKDILYSSINEIGKKKIRIDITSNIDACTKYCTDIIRMCKIRMGTEANEETLVTLCEALLHFMLTESLLPSERKVRVRDADLDIVIPSTRILSKTPNAALVIQMIIGNDLAAKIKQAEKLQPHCENIWLVSAKPIKVDHRNYNLESECFPYSHIITHINEFLAEKGNRGPKLLHGH